MVDDTLYVAAVPSERFIACDLVIHAGNRIVGRIAVCETVRHDEIYHIGCREALAVSRAFLPFGNPVWIFERLSVPGEDDVVDTRLRIRGDLHIHKQIIRALRLMHGSN